MVNFKKILAALCCVAVLLAGFPVNAGAAAATT